MALREGGANVDDVDAGLRMRRLLWCWLERRVRWILCGFKGAWGEGVGTIGKDVWRWNSEGAG